MREPPRDRKYKAFISYSRLDNVELGRRWGEWLHASLESYRIPASLRRKLNRSGGAIPDSLYPIFRDEEEMGSGAPLGALVEEGLTNSDWLIILCSPRSANRKWPNNEVTRFMEMGKGNRILPVIIEGIPNASALAIASAEDPAAEKVDPKKECLPRGLRTAVTLDRHRNSETSAKRAILGATDQLAADFRPAGTTGQGFTSAAAYREEIERTWPEDSPAPTRKYLRELEERYDRQLQHMTLKIIAGLLDVDLAELTKRDAEARARRARWIATVSTSVTLLVLILGAFALRESHERKEQLRTASRVEYEQAFRFFSTGQSPNAILHAANALQFDPENSDAGWLFGNMLAAQHGIARLPQAWSDLISMRVKCIEFSPDSKWLVAGGDGGTVWRYEIDPQRTDGDPRGMMLHHFGNGLQSAGFTADGTAMVLGSGDGAIAIYKTDRWKDPAQLDHGGMLVDLDVAPRGDFFVSLGISGVRLWKIGEATGQLLPGSEIGGFLAGAWALNARRYAAVTADGQVHVWRIDLTDDPEFRKAKALGSFAVPDCVDLEFSPSGLEIACGGSSGLTVLDADNPTEPLWQTPLDFPGLVSKVRWYACAGEERIACKLLIGLDANDGRLILLDPDDPAPTTIQADSPGPGCVEIHPHGTMVATGGIDGLLRLRHPLSGALLSFQGTIAETTELAWSPDGNWLAHGMVHGGLAIHRLEGSSSILRHTTVKSLGFSANGEWEVVAGIDGYVCRSSDFSADSRAFRHVPSKLKVTRAAIRNTGTELILWNEKEWELWKVGSVVGTTRLRRAEEILVDAAFHPLNGIAAVSVKGGKIHILDTSSGEARNTLHHGADGWPLVFDNDRELAVGGAGVWAILYNHTITNTWDGSQPLSEQAAFVKAVPALARVHSLGFATDDSLLLGSTNAAVRLDRETLNHSSLLQAQENFQSIRWSGDGRTGVVVPLTIPGRQDHRFALLEPKAWRPSLRTALPGVALQVIMSSEGDRVIVSGEGYRLEYPIFVPPREAPYWVPELAPLILGMRINPGTGEMVLVSESERTELRNLIASRVAKNDGAWERAAAWLLEDPMLRTASIDDPKRGSLTIAELLLSGDPTRVLDGAARMPQHPLVPAAVGTLPGADRKKARRLIAESLLRCEIYPDWNADLAGLCFKGRFWEETLQAFERTPLDFLENHPQLLFQKGTAHFELGHFEISADTLNRFRKKAGNSAPALRIEGWSLHLIGKNAEAAEAFREMEAIPSERDEDALVGLAVTHRASGDSIRAMDYYKRLISSDITYTDAEAISAMALEPSAIDLLLELQKSYAETSR